MLNLFFQPIEPLGEHDLTEAEIENLPSIRHRMFYTKSRDKRQWLELAAKMGVAEGTLKEMLADARGEFIVAHIQLGKDNRGEPEYKMTRFRAAEAEVEPEPFTV